MVLESSKQDWGNIRRVQYVNVWTTFECRTSREAAESMLDMFVEKYSSLPNIMPFASVLASALPRGRCERRVDAT